jgi:VWFA-related protein
MSRKVLYVAIFATAIAASILLGQTIPEDEFRWISRPYEPEIAGRSTIRLQSDLVEVPAVVLDNHEKPVGNLKKSDFLLFDDGKPQTISTFSVLTGSGSPAASVSVPSAAANATPAATPLQPRYVALFFDDVNMAEANVNKAFSNLNFAREAGIKFIRKGLDPGEHVGIFTASGTLSLDFTDDVQKLLDTLAKLRLFPRMPDQGPGACPAETPYQAWAIVNLPHEPAPFPWGVAVGAAEACGCKGGLAPGCAEMEAETIVSHAESFSLDTFASISHVIRYLGQMPGRRILVMTSSGFLTLSLKQQQEKVIEAALHANVVINSLDTAALDPSPSPFDTHFYMSFPMADMAAGTGGKFIHDSNDLEGGMRTLAAVPPVSYVLGFSPENLKANGSMHNLKVKLADPAHMTVNARPGYLAPSPDLSPAEKRFRKLGQSVMAADNPVEIPIEFTAVPETLPTGESSLKVLVHVDVRKLPFQRLSERQVERLIFITALFDAKNQFIAGVQGIMDLRLKEATLKQLSTQGLDAKLSLKAPAGSYRIRQVVQEAVSGRIAALSRTVEIH